MEDERGGKTLREAARGFSSDDALTSLDELAERVYAFRRFGETLNTVANLRQWSMNLLGEGPGATDREKVQLLFREAILKGFLKADLTTDSLIAEGMFETPHVSREPEKIGRLMWEYLEPDYDDSSARGNAVIIREIRVYTPAEIESRAGTAASYRSALPGRPSTAHLVLAELNRRIEAGETEEALAEQARVLARWLQSAHPEVHRATPGTIENQIRSLFKAAKRSPTKPTTK